MVVTELDAIIRQRIEQIMQEVGEVVRREALQAVAEALDAEIKAVAAEQAVASIAPAPAPSERSESYESEPDKSAPEQGEESESEAEEVAATKQNAVSASNDQVGEAKLRLTLAKYPHGLSLPSIAMRSNLRKERVGALLDRGLREGWVQMRQPHGKVLYYPA